MLPCIFFSEKFTVGFLDWRESRQPFHKCFTYHTRIHWQVNFCVFFFGDKDGIWIHLNAYKDESPLEAAGPGRQDKHHTGFLPILPHHACFPLAHRRQLCPLITTGHKFEIHKLCPRLSSKKHQATHSRANSNDCSLTSYYQTHTVVKGCWQCSYTFHNDLWIWQRISHRDFYCNSKTSGGADILPDDFVHAGVGEEGLIKLIVAPLPVAQQVHNDIPAELALVLHSQPCGTDNFLRIIPIHMDNCTSNDFTCPGIQKTTAITPKPFQRRQTHICSAETTDNTCNSKYNKNKSKIYDLCDESWGKERSLPWENMQLAEPVVFVNLSTTSLQALCSQRTFYT